jgi:DNA-binding transcriptional MerR regulator
VAVLKIGAFAHRASISIKTLRFYDRVGVFRPTCVDSGSGYRYYDTDQLATLQELRLLRELGCSVSNLRIWIACLHHPDSRAGLLLHLRENTRHRLDDDLRRLKAIDQWIRRLTRVEVVSGPRVPAERRIPDIPAYTLRDRVRQTDKVSSMFEAAERTVARQHARAARRPFLLLHDETSRRKCAEVEVCVPIHSDALAAIGGRLVDGARRAACVEFRGSYGRAAAARQTIQRWMRARGVHAAGPLRESYIRFGADQKGYRLPKRFVASTVAEYRTELQVPFFDA